MKFKIFLFNFLFLIIPFFSFAQNSMNTPFGGNILFTTPCSCSGGWYIMLYDVTTKMNLSIVYQFGFSRLNSNYNIFSSGANTIGSYQSGGECEVYVGETCMSMSVSGMVTSWMGPGIGSS